MKRITFKEKENSVLTNSLYILNADNINEIKLVINNLIDIFENTDFKFYDVFKFVSISAPQFYEDGEFNLIFEFSTNETFGFSKTISLKNNPELFYIFEDGKYVNFKNKNTINKNDANKLILIDVSSISLFNDIENKSNRKYYGRYKFENETITSNYFGILFGNTNFDFIKINLNNTLTVINNSNDLQFNSENKKYFELLNYDVKPHEEVNLKTVLFKDNSYIDVTQYTKYSIKNENVNCSLNDNIFIGLENENRYNLITILAETTYKYEKYYSEIKLNLIPNIIFKNVDLNFIINDDIKNQIIFKEGGDYTFDLSFKFDDNIIKYNENKDFFKLIYDNNLINIVDNKVIVKEISHDISKITSVLKIQYNDEIIEFEKEIPFTIKNEYQIKDIDITFSQTLFNEKTLNNEYKVELIDLNNKRIDITSKTNVEILNDNSYTVNDVKYNYVEFIKEEGKFNVHENTSNFDLYILFEYYDELTGRKIKKIKSITVNNNFEYLDILLNFPQKFEISETKQYDIKLKVKNKENGEILESDITNACIITSNSGLIFDNGNISFNNLHSCDVINSKQYIIEVKYLHNEKTFQKNVITTVYRNQILNIAISGPDTLNCEETSGEYSVILTYINGDKIDITKDENLKLSIVDNDNAILYENKITTTALHDPYNVILIAEYKEDGCDNLTYTASKNIYVYPYNLIYTTLSGANEIQSNKEESYHTDAYYSNGKHVENVLAKYTISDINGNIFNKNTSPLLSSYNYETNEITLKAKKTLADKEFILSSYYEEPGYEDTENSLISRKIKIIGGFNVTLYGAILTSNGKYNWNDDNINSIWFSSVGSQFIRDVTKDDDEIIKQYDQGNYSISFNWNDLNQHFTPDGYNNNIISASPANVNKLFHYSAFDTTNDNEMNDIIYGYIAKIYKTSSNEKQFLRIINTNDIFEFEQNESYEIEFCSIASLEDSYFSSSTFEINKTFEDSYVLGFEGLHFEDGFQILNIIVTFETSTGYEYTDTFTHLKECDLWIIKDIPKKATKIKSINVSYAFTNKEI